MATKGREPEAEPRLDVKQEVAQTLIEAMKEGNTPWQRPWIARAMKPTNAVTDNAYRGINLVLLGLAGGAIASRVGQADERWMTYRQAEGKGWQVRRGEKGTMIVKLVELDRNEEGASNSGGSRGAASEEKASDRQRFALRRYVVFNAAQVDGVPPLDRSGEPVFEPVKRAEAIMDALVTQTGLKVVYGGNQACYVPSLDEVRLPPKQSFRAVGDMPAAYGFYGVALHECSHSSLAPHRMNRREALGKRWGDEAYAMEELTVEIAAACLAAETGVPMSQEAAHVKQHAAYLNSWIKVIENDPMAIFTAAKAADAIAAYLLGLERQRTSLAPHAEWIEAYERKNRELAR